MMLTSTGTSTEHKQNTYKMSKQQQQKAIQVVEKGKVELRSGVPVDEVGDNDVLLQVHAVGINPVDNFMAAYNFTGNAFPFTLGYDVAGVVKKVGKNVHDFKDGDAVFGHNSLKCNGSFAEYSVISANRIVKKPAALSWAQVAGIPVAFLSAYDGLSRVNIKAGEVLYVPGGAGGVGHFAVQIGHILGAKVITSGGREESMKLLHELKVDSCFNYKEKNPTEAVKEFTKGKGADVIYECVAKPQDLHVTAEALADHGRMTVLGKPDIDKLKVHEVLKSKQATYVPCDLGSYSFNGKDREFFQPALTQAAEWVASGKLVPKNTVLHSLEEVNTFLQQLKQGKTVNGKAIAVFQH